MALIIKGNMPDTCLSEVSSELHCPIVDSCLAFHNAYHHRFEPLGNAHKCRLKDCPILGEIPDEHGRLVDADKLLADHNPNENWDYMVLECIIRNAPTVVEATT